MKNPLNYFNGEEPKKENIESLVTVKEVPNPQMRVFNVKSRLITGDLEQYMFSSDLEERVDSAKRTKSGLSLAKKLWDLDGVTHVGIDKYYVDVGLADAFKFDEQIQNKIIEIISGYIKSKQTSKNIIDEVTKNQGGK